MQARHRIGPGNGYRSNAIGMRGLGAASRVSPEGMVRGYRAYNSEHRNHGRGGGYGRGGGGHSRQFQPPGPQSHPPRQTDIFVEAGKLAAEYLVSKGILPPSVLLGKWNDGLKNQVGGVESRLGNSTLDVGPGRRRYADEYNSTASRNSVRGRRGNWPFRNHESSDERSRTPPGMEAESDASACHHDEQPAVKDGNGGTRASSPGEIIQEGDSATHSESGLEKCDSVEDAGAKGSSSNEKYQKSDADGEIIKEAHHANMVDEDTVNEGKNDNDLEQNQEENKEVTASEREDTVVSGDNVHLVKDCKFENVLTEAHCEQDAMHEDEDKNAKRELSEGSGIRTVDVVSDISAANASTNQNQELKSLESDVLHATAMETPVNEEQVSDTVRGEKRVMDDDIDSREGFKKLREWITSMDVQPDNCLPQSNSVENHPTSNEQRTSQSSHGTLSPEQKSLNITLFPKGHAGPYEFIQEKQLFPGSFKTCDLNLIGTCDANENHVADSALTFPSVSETREEVRPIDVDLSMSNNFNLPKRNGKHGINDNDIEVIDLENDPAQEDKTFSNPERRGDTAFSDLDGFPNNVHNANENPDVQDGYGLMISELLGNNSPSSVPTDLNSLNNDVGLPNGEAILGDDDAIYMSLGEIPISFLRSWEQPTQDYGKPF